MKRVAIKGIVVWLLLFCFLKSQMYADIKSDIAEFKNTIVETKNSVKNIYTNYENALSNINTQYEQTLQTLDSINDINKR